MKNGKIKELMLKFMEDTKLVSDIFDTLKKTFGLNVKEICFILFDYLKEYKKRENNLNYSCYFFTEKDIVIVLNYYKEGSWDISFIENNYGGKVIYEELQLGKGWNLII